MHVITVGIDGEDEYGNVRHRAHVDKLLNGIADVPFVAEEIAHALNGIARCVDDDSGGEHFQRFAISLRPIRFRRPRPMEQCFECEQMQPIEVKQLQNTNQFNFWIPFSCRIHLRSMSRARAKFERSSNTFASSPI